jgi:hypothetical protein
MSSSAKSHRNHFGEQRVLMKNSTPGEAAGSASRGNARGRITAATILLTALLAWDLGIVARGAQEDESSARTPMLSKKTMGGTRRAFSGKIETLDLKRKVLTVSTVEGGATEIFPVKKGISVSGARGKKLKIEELAPGTNVIVYYDYRDGRRTISEIMVLAVSPSQDEKKKSPPPS